ncbi:hypothetical protein L596_005798 [Steinernema carpocapsae]|uniref:Uncharacterized protein n=1 Tax=Steinernema carpocapsae TaxID=34508 RepID=A0A4V6I8K6_STECR|nr:hypothetical protein L596_005798 [Steinernema carpocapsae]
MHVVWPPRDRDPCENVTDVFLGPSSVRQLNSQSCFVHQRALLTLSATSWTTFFIAAGMISSRLSDLPLHDQISFFPAFKSAL